MPGRESLKLLSPERNKNRVEQDVGQVEAKLLVGERKDLHPACAKCVRVVEPRKTISFLQSTRLYPTAAHSPTLWGDCSISNKQLFMCALER